MESSSSEQRATRVLELVRGLTAEVHPHAARVTVTLDSPFDALGIGSLELAELLLRVLDVFGVALPAHLLSNAETPRDLLRAVARTGAPVKEQIGTIAAPATAGGAPAPVAASTLIDALDWHVGATPERTHIRILDESGAPVDLTYQMLRRDAAAVAAGLLARDVMPGDTVAIMLPTGREYFVTFAGVVLAGAVPVPIYPPARPSQLADHLRRHTAILANARAALLVTVPEAIPLGHCCARMSTACATSWCPNPSRVQRVAPFLGHTPTPSRWCSTPRAAPASPKALRSHMTTCWPTSARWVRPPTCPGGTRSSVGCRCITTWV